MMLIIGISQILGFVILICIMSRFLNVFFLLSSLPLVWYGYWWHLGQVGVL